MNTKTYVLPAYFIQVLICDLHFHQNLRDDVLISAFAIGLLHNSSSKPKPIIRFTTEFIIIFICFLLPLLRRHIGTI